MRQFYNAFRYDPQIKIKNFSRATTSTLIKIYEQLIEKNPKFLLDELQDKSEIYSRFISPDKDDEFYSGLRDLLHVGAAPSYILLLYFFSKYYEDTNLLEQIIQFLVKYFVRRNITDFPATRELDKIFIDLVDISEEKGEITFSFVKNYLTAPGRFADDETFINMLLGDIYITNTNMARFILSKLEESHMTKENWRDLWAKTKYNKYIWTIEHILPEGGNLPKEWIQTIADGDAEKAKIIQGMCVHKLGNLTLTAYNSNLSNFSFIKKRDRVDDKSSNYIGYKNGLYLNKELAEKENWTVEDITNRTKKLVKEVFELFAVEDRPLPPIKLPCLDGEE